MSTWFCSITIVLSSHDLDTFSVVEVRYLGKPPVDLSQDSGTWSYNVLEDTARRQSSTQSSSISRTTWNPDAIGEYTVFYVETDFFISQKL